MHRTKALSDRLARFGERLVRLPATRAEAESLFEETLGIFDAINWTEARHIDSALERVDFPFEAAQAALESCCNAFARLAREAKAGASALFSEGEARKLEEMVFLAEKAPVTSLAGLERIRAAEEGRKRLQRAKTG